MNRRETITTQKVSSFIGRSKTASSQGKLFGIIKRNPKIHVIVKLIIVRRPRDHMYLLLSFCNLSDYELPNFHYFQFGG